MIVGGVQPSVAKVPLFLLWCTLYFVGAQEDRGSVSPTEADSDDSTMSAVVIGLGVFIGLILIVVVGVTIFSLLRSNKRKDYPVHASNVMAKTQKYSLRDEDKWSMYTVKGHEIAV